MPRVAPVVLLVLLSHTASADENASRAKEHFQRGATLYDLQRYPEAAREFEQAFEIKDDPVFLFNIGQSYRFSGEPQKAIGAYKAYLRRSPEAPNRKEVEGRLEELQRQIAEKTKSQEKPPAGTIAPGETPKAQETPLYKKWWLWTIVGGVVVAGAATGIGLGVDSQSGPAIPNTSLGHMTVSF